MERLRLERLRLERSAASSAEAYNLHYCVTALQREGILCTPAPSAGGLSAARRVGSAGRGRTEQHPTISLLCVAA